MIWNCSSKNLLSVWSVECPLESSFRVEHHFLDDRYETDKNIILASRACNPILWGLLWQNFKCVIDDAQQLSFSGRYALSAKHVHARKLQKLDLLDWHGTRLVGLFFACTCSSMCSVQPRVRSYVLLVQRLAKRRGWTFFLLYYRADWRWQLWRFELIFCCDSIHSKKIRLGVAYSRDRGARHPAWKNAETAGQTSVEEAWSAWHLEESHWQTLSVPTFSSDASCRSRPRVGCTNFAIFWRPPTRQERFRWCKPCLGLGRRGKFKFATFSETWWW